MKAFIALLISTLAVAAQGSSPYVVQPVAGWNNLGHAAYHYDGGVNQVVATSLYGGYRTGWYGGRRTTVEPNVAKVNSWGFSPAVEEAYAYGYDNYLGGNGKYGAPVVSGLVHEVPLVGYGVNSNLIVGGHGY